MNIIKIGLLLLSVGFGLLFVLADNPLEFLGDISSLMFFFFALVAMFAISTAIAHQLVIRNHYILMEDEYNKLKKDMQHHINRFSYEIHFSDEAINKHEQLIALQDKLENLKGESYGI